MKEKITAHLKLKDSGHNPPSLRSFRPSPYPSTQALGPFISLMCSSWAFLERYHQITHCWMPSQLPLHVPRRILTVKFYRVLLFTIQYIISNLRPPEILFDLCTFRSLFFILYVQVFFLYVYEYNICIIVLLETKESVGCPELSYLVYM